MTSYLSPAILAEIAARQQAMTARMESYRKVANAQTASRLGEQFAKWGNALPADALTAMVLGGVSDEVIARAANAAGQLKLASGDPTQGSRPEHHQRPWWQRPVNTVGDFIADNPITNTMQNNNLIQGTVRGATMAMQAPYEAVTGALANSSQSMSDIARRIPGAGAVADKIYNDVSPDQGGKRSWVRDLVGVATGGWVDTAQPGDVLRGTTIAQAAATGDAGSGFFAGGEAFKQQADRSREFRGTVGGHGWTVGRVLASSVVEPGTDPYTLLSGSVDFATALVADPTNIVGGEWVKARKFARVANAGTDLDKAALAAKTAMETSRQAKMTAGLMTLAGGDPTNPMAWAASFEKDAARISDEAVAKAAAKAGKRDPGWAKKVTDAAGLIDARRRTIFPPKALEWLYSREGQDVVTWLVNNKSATRAWLAYDKQMSMGLARQLAEADKATEVIGLLGKAFTSGSLETLPTAGRWSGAMGPLGMRVVHEMQDRFRWFDQVPLDTMLKFGTGDEVNASSKTLWNALGNIGIKGDERMAWMDDWIDAATGNPLTRSSDVYHYGHRLNEALATHLVNNGVDTELAKKVTSMTREWDKFTQWQVDELGNNLPLDLPGLPDGTLGPDLLVEMLDHGISMYDKSELRKIRAQTSAVSRILLGSAGVGEQYGSGRRLPISMIEYFQSRLWKPSVLLRPAYLTRVLPEEMLRVSQGGSFDRPIDFLLTIIGHATQYDEAGRLGRVRTGINRFTGALSEKGRNFNDALGQVWNVGGEADKVGRQMADMRAILAETAAGSAEEAAAKAHLKALGTRMSKIEKQAEEAMSTYQDSLAGLVRGKVTKYLDDTSITDRMVRRGQVRLVEQASDPYRWSVGVADEIIKRHSDPLARRIAQGALNETDTVPAGVTRDGLDGITNWLVHGNGRFALETLKSSQPSAYWVSDEWGVARAWVQRIAEQNVQWTGGRQSLMDAIATGKFDGEKIGELKPYGRRKASEALRKNIEAWGNDPEALSPTHAPYFPSVSERLRKGNPIDEFGDRVVSWFFTDAYGKPSDYLSRSPEFKGAYWKHSEQLVGTLSGSEAAKLVENARLAKLPKAQLARIEERAALAHGKGDLQGLDMLAKGRALDDTKQLLYDVANRSQFFDVFRILFPFGEAWKEIASTWARLVVENPVVLNRARKAIQGARGAGFFYTDPTTGQEVFAYPLSGELGKRLTGTQVRLTGDVRGLSLGTQIIPGMGPVAAWPVAKLIEDKPEFKTAMDIMMPYGPPSSPMPSLIPPWAKKMQAIFNSPDSDRTYMNMYADVLRAKAASGHYGWSADEQQRLENDSKTAARALYVLRGFVQATAPAAPSPEFRIHTTEGDKVVEVLANDYRTMQDDLGFDKAPEAFLAKYGDAAVWYMTNKTKSEVGGLEATTAFGDWQKRNKGIVKDYDQVASYFGPHDSMDAFSLDVYGTQMAKGQRTRKSPKQIIEDTNSIVARMIVDRAKQALPTNESEWSDDQRQWMQKVKAGLIEQLPGYDPTGAYDRAKDLRAKRIRQFERAVQDDRLSGNQTAQAVKVYLIKRREAINAGVDAGLSQEGWARAKKMAYMRDWLRKIGTALASADPGFSRAWGEVFENEMIADQEST